MNKDMFNFGVDPNKKPTPVEKTTINDVTSTEHLECDRNVISKNVETVTEEVIEPTIIEETIINDVQQEVVTKEQDATIIETPETEIEVKTEVEPPVVETPVINPDPRDELIKNMMEQMEAMTSAIKSMKDKGNKNGKETYKF